MPFHFANRISRIVHWGKKAINNKRLTINAKGFTLIEILVVLSIMAVLAGGLLYSTNNARDKGKDARRKDDLKAVSTALVAYYTDHNKYPPTNAGDPFDYVSDSSDPSGWIPPLQPYLNKFPKDPLQAGILAPLAAVFENGKKIAGGSWSWLSTNQTTAQKPKGQVAGLVSYSGSPQVSADDGKRISSTGARNNEFSSTIIDNPTGTMFECPDSRSNYIRFPNVSIPTTATNIQASIVFTPRHNGLDSNVDDTINSTNVPGNIKTIFRAELTTSDATQVTSGDDFSNRPKTVNGDTNGDGLPDSVEWNDIPVWWSGGIANPANRTSPDLAPLFQKLISQSGWNASAKAVNIFWMDNGSAANCPGGSGRVGVSRDGQNSGVNVGGVPSTAPILNITYNTPTPAGTIVCEAEAGTLVAPMTSTADATASGGNYISSSVDDQSNSLGPTGLPNGTGGSSTFQVYIANPGTYYYWSRNKYPPTITSNNSYWVEFPPGNTQTPTGTYIKAGNEDPGNSNWHWYENANGDSTPVRITYNFPTAGTYQIKLYGRENDTYIDKFELVPTDSTYTPSGSGDSTNCPTSAPSPTTQCNDFVDNADPEDTLVDGVDPGCSSPTDDDETDTVVTLPTTGACNDKPTNVYCLRTSANQKAFVLWAMLENTNDPQLFTNTTTALCNSDDPDFSPANTTSPYFGLNAFTGSPGFNYCIKSPQ